MQQIWQQLKAWYDRTYNRMTTWLGNKKIEENELEIDLVDLPPEIIECIEQKIAQLSTPEPMISELQERLDTALENWCDRPSLASNALVVIHSSVDSAFSALKTTLANRSSAKNIPVKWLQWQTRPTDISKISDKLKKQLGRAKLTKSEQRREIIIIPDLNQCFLRSVEGLDGIEFLQNNLLSDRYRFWLIGVDLVAWIYLDSVCQLAAYCQQTWSLPALTGKQLQNWLEPVISEIEPYFRSQIEEILKRSSERSDQEKAEARKSAYFERLAATSRGIGTVAIELFWQTFSLEAEQQKDEAKVSSHSDRVVVSMPSVPALPQLEPEERYLLYSLILHKKITANHLAESLGTDVATVQNLLQTARNRGIVEQEGEWLSLDPIFYPAVIDELKGNNFLI